MFGGVPGRFRGFPEKVYAGRSVSNEGPMMELTNIELGVMVAFILLLIIIVAIIWDCTKDEYAESWSGSWRHDRR